MLTVLPVLVIALVVGLVAFAARACSDFADAWGRDTWDTSASTLAHYALAVPAEATSASAFESTSFNGPDLCFFEFSLPEQGLGGYLDGLNAVPSEQGPQDVVDMYGEIEEFHLPGWHFDNPHAGYTVYDWHAVTSISDSAGSIIVERAGTQPRVFVVATTMSPAATPVQPAQGMGFDHLEQGMSGTAPMSSLQWKDRPVRGDAPVHVRVGRDRTADPAVVGVNRAPIGECRLDGCCRDKRRSRDGHQAEDLRAGGDAR